MRLQLLPMIVCCAFSCSSPYGQSGTPPKNGSVKQSSDSTNPSTGQPLRRDAGAVGTVDDEGSRNGGGASASSGPPTTSSSCVESCKEASPQAAAILEEANACASFCEADDDVCFAECEVMRIGRCEEEAGGCEAILECVDGCP